MSYLARGRRPLIASLTSADAEFNHWVSENDYRHLADQNGTIWELQLRLEQFPHPLNALKTLFRLHISISTYLEANSLLQLGVLKRDEDERLLAMVGDSRVYVPIKIKLLEATTLEDLRSELAAYIVKLRSGLRKRDLSQLKRRMLGQWIDQKSLFGHALGAVQHDKIELEV